MEGMRIAARRSRGGMNHLVMFPGPGAAIENTCRLIDEGHDVFGVGAGALTNSIEREQIARIYARWASAKSPFIGPVR